MRFRSLAPVLVALFACGAPLQATVAESDAHAVMDPERDVVLHVDGAEVRASDQPGAEDGEAVSPDGRHVAWVGGATGIASVWVAEVPAAGESAREPVQLTNVGLEHQPRTVGQAPQGFVPPPDRGPLRWADDRTVVWTAGGREYRAELGD